MGQIGCELGEITNCHGSFDTQTVGFDENTGVLQPREEMVLFTVELYVAKTSVAKHVATDADVRLVLFIDPRGRYFEEFLKCRFAVR